jgi:fatty acid desaturase
MQPALLLPRAVDAPFSLAQARGIVRDLFTPRESIYWIDFLATITLGHICFGLTRLLYEIHLQPLWLRLILQAATFTVQCACYYRAVIFVHEIVHQPERPFRAFRIVWHLLCGIPLLVPSFTYQTHVDHHRGRTFGTAHDAEYLPLASLSPGWIVLYLSQCLWVPAVALMRFGLATPLVWLVPPLRSFIHARVSSLVMNPAYLRPQPTAADLRAICWQEAGCFGFVLACAVIPPVFLDRWPIPLLIQAYATAVVLVFLNSVRTIASHRWRSDGQESTFLDQMLDSVTLDSNSPLALLVFPVGQRYHAAHHLFPSLPYHNLPAAHERLMQRLPAGSPYRRTVETSFLAVAWNLVRRAADHRRERRIHQLAASV